MRVACLIAILLGTLVFQASQPAQAQTPGADALQSSLLTTQAAAAAKAGKYKEAEDLYLKATALNSKNGKAWRGLGQVTHLMGDEKKARNFYKEGWACGDIPSLRALGALALLENDYAQFGELLPDLMSRKDLDVEIRCMIVLYYKNSGKMSPATLQPVLQGMDLTALGKVSVANLITLLEGYQAAGNNRAAGLVQAELSRRK